MDAAPPLSAAVIDGRALAARVREQVARDAAELVRAHGRPPGLATILVGEDPASAVYVGAKHRACEAAGIASFDHRLPAGASAAEVAALIARLNADPAVDGTILQLPLPAHLDGTALAELVDPGKDVDGLTTASAGRLALGLPGLRPCTPSGCMDLLAEAGCRLEGAEAVVVGRSNLFGKPMAQMLTAADATVTVCHSRTADLAAACRRADVLIVAVGRPQIVRADWVKPGATVVDVGINRLDGSLVGDVAFEEVAAVAGAITPVPGGVGPMTIAGLLRNTVAAARARLAERTR